jgi:hypothetical protein
MGLCKKVLHAWILHVRTAKQTKTRIQEAQEWRRNVIVKDALCQWFHASQQLAWNMQRQSGLTELELRAALKYGIRWRMNTFKNRKQAAERNTLKLAHSQFDCSFPSYQVDKQTLRLRTSPRVPEFLFRNDNSTLERLRCHFIDSHEERNSESPQPVVQSDYTIDQPLLPPSIAVIEGRDDEKERASMSDKEKEEAVILDQLEQLLLNEKKALAQYLIDKKQLEDIDQDLCKYVQLPFSHKSGFDFESTLSRHRGLKKRVKQFETSKSHRKKKIYELKSKLEAFKHQIKH